MKNVRLLTVLMLMSSSSVFAAESKVICAWGLDLTSQIEQINKEIAAANSAGFSQVTAPASVAPVGRMFGALCVTVTK